MGQITGSMNNTDAQVLSKSIAQTRKDMSGTLEQLHGHLNPEILKEEVLKQLHDAKDSIKAEIQTGIGDAKSALREATIGKVETMIHNTQAQVRSTARSVTEVLTANPLPTALVGIGLVWLFADARARAGGASGTTVGTRVGKGIDAIKDTAADLAHGAEHLAERASSSISETVHEVSGTLTTASANAKRSIEHAAHTASDQVGQLAHNAVGQGRNTLGRAERMYLDNPLAVGAALVVAGAAIGVSFPITKREVAWMGDARARVVKEAEALATEAISKVDGQTQRIESEAAAAKNDASPATHSTV
jgi:gas vesicle protein